MLVQQLTSSAIKSGQHVASASTPRLVTRYVERMRKWVSIWAELRESLPALVIYIQLLILSSCKLGSRHTIEVKSLSLNLLRAKSKFLNCVIRTGKAHWLEASRMVWEFASFKDCKLIHLRRKQLNPVAENEDWKYHFLLEKIASQTMNRA